jgi:hypothetical protein
MKLYLANYNIKDLHKKLPILDKYFLKNKSQIEIYSSEGVFFIDDTNVLKLTVDDKDICVETYENFNENNEKIDIIIDSSVLHTCKTNQIPPNHLSLHTTNLYFILSEKSNLKLVIQGSYIDKPSIDKYNDFLPCDFYFEIPHDIDIHNVLFKEELVEFLSLLN